MTENYINQIDLQYLLNKEHYEKQVRSKMSKNIHKKDRKFYRKRILNLTKELLYPQLRTNSMITPDIKYTFDGFIKTCVEHFKTIDQNDILQEEFKDLDDNSQLLEDEFDEIELSTEDANKLMMRSVSCNVNTLDKFITKMKVNKEEPQIVLPQQKEIKLDDPILKTKGIIKREKRMKKTNEDNILEDKKENINIIYEDEKIENKETNKISIKKSYKKKNIKEDLEQKPEDGEKT